MSFTRSQSERLRKKELTENVIKEGIKFGKRKRKDKNKKRKRCRETEYESESERKRQDKGLIEREN